MAKKFYTKAPTRLPGDLLPKPVTYKPQLQGYDPSAPLSNDDLIRLIKENTDVLVATSIVERGLLGRTVNITTTPVRVVAGQFLRGYIFQNPTSSSGLTSAGTIFDAVTAASGASADSTAVPVGVANYNRMGLFLVIDAASGGGSVQIDALTQDPILLGWADSQTDLFGVPTAAATYYANIGTLGVDSAFAARYTIAGGVPATFSLNFVVKDGIIGSASGLPNTIYLGGPDVTTLTGYRLLEGKELELYFRPNAELWAISEVAAGVPLNIFDLQ